MDIYSMINSRDIAEHCRKINHQFNALETAFIVYWPKFLALREKHKAYRHIIETMPDVDVTTRSFRWVHIKREIDYALLLNAYEIIRHEKHLRDNWHKLGIYTDAGKELAGLSVEDTLIQAKK